MDSRSEQQLDFQCIFIQYERHQTGGRMPVVWPSAGFAQWPSYAASCCFQTLPLLRLHASAPYTHIIVVAVVTCCLVTSSPALSDDLGHLVNLSLRTAESTESLLCELSGTLVLAVTEKFDDAALIWCEAVCKH